MLNRAKLMQKKKQVIQQQNKEIAQETNQKLTEQLAAFTKNLEAFATKYKDEIQFNKQLCLLLFIFVLFFIESSPKICFL